MENIIYKNTPIDYDTLGFYTVLYCSDEIVFDTVEEAKKFIDEYLI